MVDLIERMAITGTQQSQPQVSIFKRARRNMGGVKTQGRKCKNGKGKGGVRRRGQSLSPLSGLVSEVYVEVIVSDCNLRGSL